jgi:HPt (histidine-containing phosphotransfer) domain-containing protein
MRKHKKAWVGSTALQILDFSQLRNITMNDATLMREVVDSLLSDASEQIDALRRALERTDTKEWVRLAHGLVGACGNVGAVSLAAVSSSLEHYAAVGDIPLCKSSVEHLSAEVEKLRTEAGAIR